MRALRKFLSILLLLVLGAPVVSPLFALGTDSEARLPICCRSGGVHRCLAARVSETHDGVMVSRATEPCPYRQGSVASAHHETLAFGGDGSAVVVLTSQAAAVAQAESMWRIARDRSRHKRGPPALLV